MGEQLRCGVSDAIQIMLWLSREGMISGSILLFVGTVLFLYVGSVTSMFLLFGWVGGILAIAFLMFVSMQLVTGLFKVIAPFAGLIA